MSKYKNNQNKFKMFKPDPFFTQLDSFSKDLRESAYDLANFLEIIKETSPCLRSLIKSLRTLVAMPINTIDTGIQDIQFNYFELNKEISLNRVSPFNDRNLIQFIEKQDKFNREAQCILSKAMELYKSNCNIRV